MTQTNRDICSLANKTQKIISNIQAAPGECTKSYQIDVVSKKNVIQSNKNLGAWCMCVRLSVVQQNMRVTRQIIVLPLLTKALHKFGCFEGMLQKTKFATLLFY
jgi:hypothetical protein